MAIRITRVYTRRGDDGDTDLVGGARVPKDHARIDAYGTVDELNAALGVVRAVSAAERGSDGARAELDAILRKLQSELFDLGAELATPPASFVQGMFRVGDAEVRALEATMDRCQADLAPLKSFVLPGGGITSAQLHVARTVCRRAERDVLRLMRVEPVGPGPLRYLNRLSDLLFVLSRWIGHRRGEREFLWERPLEREAAVRAAREKPSTRKKPVARPAARDALDLYEAGRAAGREETPVSEPLYFKQLELGPMQNYVYLFGDPQTREAAVVDAAWDVDHLIEVAGADGYRITKNLVTHFHPDHLGGNLMGHQIAGAAELAAKAGAKTYVQSVEVPYVHRVCGLAASDLVGVAPGDTAEVGRVRVTFLHTPGHTPGSQCFLVGNTCISGDTLFIGSCGRVDLPGSNAEDMYRSLTGTLASLPDETILLPGHNYADRPRSTIGDEKRTNAMMRFKNLKDFLALMSPLRD